MPIRVIGRMTWAKSAANAVWLGGADTGLGRPQGLVEEVGHRRRRLGHERERDEQRDHGDDDAVDDPAHQAPPPLGEHGTVGQHVAAGRRPALAVGVVPGGRHAAALPLARSLRPVLAVDRPRCPGSRPAWPARWSRRRRSASGAGSCWRSRSRRRSSAAGSGPAGPRTSRGRAGSSGAGSWRQGLTSSREPRRGHPVDHRCARGAASVDGDAHGSPPDEPASASCATSR